MDRGLGIYSGLEALAEQTAGGRVLSPEISRVGTNRLQDPHLAQCPRGRGPRHPDHDPLMPPLLRRALDTSPHAGPARLGECRGAHLGVSSTCGAPHSGKRAQ